MIFVLSSTVFQKSWLCESNLASWRKGLREQESQALNERKSVSLDLQIGAKALMPIEILIYLSIQPAASEAKCKIAVASLKVSGLC